MEGIKLTLTEDGELLAGVYDQLKENLSEAQLELILDYIEGIVKVIREVNSAIGELEEGIE